MIRRAPSGQKKPGKPQNLPWRSLHIAQISAASDVRRTPHAVLWYHGHKQRKGEFGCARKPYILNFKPKPRKSKTAICCKLATRVVGDARLPPRSALRLLAPARQKTRTTPAEAMALTYIASIQMCTHVCICLGYLNTYMFIKTICIHTHIYIYNNMYK